MSGQINFGLIGAGRIGAFHARNIKQYTDAKIYAVADVVREAADRLAREVGAEKTYYSPEDLIKDERVDAIVICLPNNLHYQVSMMAIEAGKHVFCEKPLCLKSSEAEDLVRRVRKAGVKFQVGYNRRFDKSYENVKKLIEDGDLGRLVLAYSNTFDPEPHSGWEANEKLSGGILFTTCSHDFDMLYWLIGSRVRRVYTESRGAFGRDQYLMSLLSFENDVLGVVSVFEACPYGHDVKTEIIGDKASIRVEMPAATYLKKFDKNGVHTDYPYWFLDRFGHSYIKEIQDFVRCIKEDKEPRVTVEDGAHVVKICEAARESLLKRMPIDIG